MFDQYRGNASSSAELMKNTNHPKVLGETLVEGTRRAICGIILTLMTADADAAERVLSHKPSPQSIQSKRVTESKHSPHTHAITVEVGHGLGQNVSVFHAGYSLDMRLTDGPIRWHWAPGLAFEFGSFGHSIEKGDRYYATPLGMEITYRFRDIPWLELLGSFAVGAGISHTHTNAVVTPPNRPLREAIVYHYNPFAVVEAGTKIYWHWRKQALFSGGTNITCDIGKNGNKECGLYLLLGGGMEF